MTKSLDPTLTGILKNDIASQQLATEGYTTFPFLLEDDIKKLTEYYHLVQPETPDYFYASTHSPDFAFRRRVSDFIKDIVAIRLDNQLKDYELLGGAFVVKPANGKIALNPHQDWNLVDENISRSYNLWIPLVDVNINNAALLVLPKSHNKMPTYRGPGIPSIFKAIEQEIWSTLNSVEMKAGEALLYDHALLHASPVNQTDQIRLGVVCGIIPKNASMQMFFGTNGNIESYKADVDFFLDKDPMKGPDGLELITKNCENVNFLSREEYNSRYLNIKQSKENNWLSRLLSRNK